MTGGAWQQDFEDNEAGWVAYAKNAQVGITRDPENVHEGLAALQFNYDFQAGATSRRGRFPMRVAWRSSSS